jgi:hypothetical protein
MTNTGGHHMDTITEPLPQDADMLVGYLEQLQMNADQKTWWRRLRTQRVTDDQRRRRAIRDFRAVVGRVDRDRRGPAAPAHPGLPAACALVQDVEFREQVYRTIEAVSLGEPWWRTSSSPYATA